MLYSHRKRLVLALLAVAGAGLALTARATLAPITRTHQKLS
jgi:hypothetical protein